MSYMFRSEWLGKQSQEMRKRKQGKLKKLAIVSNIYLSVEILSSSCRPTVFVRKCERGKIFSTKELDKEYGIIDWVTLFTIQWYGYSRKAQAFHLR